ncbi:MAG: hypothetical protein WBB00_22285 [Mycobacterium sp.]
MEVKDLIAVLDAQDPLTSVIRKLGTDCVDNRDDVVDDDYPAKADVSRTLRRTVAEESFRMWDAEGKFVIGPSDELKGQLTKLWLTPSLATITVLEGICFGAAKVYFANASFVVRIERGLVAPLPERWLPGLAETPKPPTMHQNLLDEPCNFVLWEHDWALELDYRCRERLDQVCAVRRPDMDIPATKSASATLAYGLPKIATVHPFGGDQMAAPVFDHERERFYSVQPALPTRSPTVSSDDLRKDNHQHVLDALALVGSQASVAVLPEFCLHSPDGLDDLLPRYADRLPALVVAGSAHRDVAVEQGRANTSHVFLDRVRIFHVSKHEAFAIRGKDYDGSPVIYREDIKRVPRVLRVAAGTATRLAVAICSDLNSSDFQKAMRWAGVNFLLSPSWTPRVGGFAGALIDLATSCQCVGVVANTPGHLLARPHDPPPFWAYTVVPREPGAGEDRTYPPQTTPAVGVLDPNLMPGTDGYWLWAP